MEVNRTSVLILPANEGRNLQRPLKIIDNHETEKYQFTEFINNHFNTHILAPFLPDAAQGAGYTAVTFHTWQRQQELCSHIVLYIGNGPCKPVK